jgi:hypothetical protein
MAELVMGEMADDPFGGAQFAESAPPPPLGHGDEPLDMGTFSEVSTHARCLLIDLHLRVLWGKDADVPNAPSMQMAGETIPPPEINGMDHLNHDVVQMSPQESQAAFIGGYTIPAPAPEAAAVAAPAAVDPRVQWRAKNHEQLVKRDSEEAAAKKAAAEKAKAHLAKFNEQRTKLLSSRKKANRDAEQASPEAGVPAGPVWASVQALIASTSDKVHTKDLSRFKACISTAKTLNVAVSAK